MAIREGQEIVAVEDVGGNKLTPELTEVTDSGQAIPGPSRAAHDDLGFDLVGHREARDGHHACPLEAGDNAVRGSVSQRQLQGVGDVPVVVHADQELLVVADAGVVSNSDPASHDLVPRVMTNLDPPPRQEPTPRGLTALADPRSGPMRQATPPPSVIVLVTHRAVRSRPIRLEKRLSQCPKMIK